jgi:hypothetical protein
MWKNKMLLVGYQKSTLPVNRQSQPDSALGYFCGTFA